MGRVWAQPYFHLRLLIFKGIITVFIWQYTRGTKTGELQHPMGLPRWLRWHRICLQCRRPRFDSWVRKIPWRRKWQLAPVFLPGEFHGQRILAGYSPRGSQRVRHDWAIHTHTHTHTHHNMLVVLVQDLGRFPQMLSQLEAYGLQKHLFWQEVID